MQRSPSNPIAESTGSLFLVHADGTMQADGDLGALHVCNKASNARREQGYMDISSLSKDSRFLLAHPKFPKGGGGLPDEACNVTTAALPAMLSLLFLILTLF